MKKVFILFLLFTLFHDLSFAQDSYKKRYYVKDKVEYGEKFYYKNKLDSKSNGSTLTLNKVKGTIDPAVLKIAKNGKGLLSNVAFSEKDSVNYLFINPWLVNTGSGYIDRNSIYYYKLENRQSVKIKFEQWSFNALTIPLKVRFAKDKTEFSTGANLGALLGYTWGKTNFVHRTKIGNKQYDTKSTFGMFLGSDKLEFSYKDENETEVKIKTAVLSSGFGYMFAYQNFSFGLLGGLDFGLGENSSKWDFQGRPWLGVSIGYSLFTF